MSLGYGPQALTPGALNQFRINKNAVAVQIRNFSRYFVGVYFGSDPPIGSSTTALVPGFHDVIAPGEQPVLSIVGNYTNDPALLQNGLTEFTGDVFLLPISIDASLGLTGGSSSNFATLTSYLSGESLPASTAAPRIVDASSQPRAVGIPLAVPRNSGKWTPSGAGAILTLFDLALAPANFLLNGNTGVVNAYLYAIKAKVAAPGGIANAFLEWIVEMLLQDSTHTTLAGYPAQEVYRDVGSLTFSTAAGFAFQPGEPTYPGGGVVGRQGFTSFTGLVPAAAFVRFQMRAITFAGAPSLYFNALADIDLANLRTPGGIGEFGINSGIF